MLASEIVNALNAQPLAIKSRDLLDKNYSQAFASDLMSDVLAVVQHEPGATVLITGLCNAQSLRTAEMLDIDMIVFVRGKKPVGDALELVEEAGFNVFTTDYTMYEACGILFSKGLGGSHGIYSV